MHIPFLSLKDVNQSFEPELSAKVLETVKNGWYIRGKECATFKWHRVYLLPANTVDCSTTLLLDREALCDLTDGAAIPAYSMIFDTMQNFNKDAKDWFQKNLANNHDEGIKLIEAAGYTKGSDGFYQKDGQVLTFNFYASSSSLSSVLAEGLQGQFQNYGIQINLNSIDWNYVHEQVKSDDYDFARESLAWAEPILILNTCYYDKNAPTATDAYYAEVKDIAATVDSDERTKKIGDIQMKMFENIDILPFYSEIGHLAYSSGLSGVKINSDGSLDWNDVGWA